MKETCEDLCRRIREAPEPREEVLDAYLFGSHALGRATDHSDVDLAVFTRPGAQYEVGGYGYAADLAAHLMAALGESRVDLVLLNDAAPLLYHRVLRDGVRVLSRDLPATTTREGYALSRYCDYLPQLRKIAEAAARRADAGEFGR